jgi:hypothetical protein
VRAFSEVQIVELTRAVNRLRKETSLSDRLTTLGELLGEGDEGEEINVDQMLYLPFDRRWELDTPAVLSEGDPDGEPDWLPPLALERGFEYALGTDAVSQVVSNALEQKPDASLETLLKAFLFYYDNDAFIELDVS